MQVRILLATNSILIKQLNNHAWDKKSKDQKTTACRETAEAQTLQAVIS
jgi:hypothetical protein